MIFLQFLMIIPLKLSLTFCHELLHISEIVVLRSTVTSLIAAGSSHKIFMNVTPPVFVFGRYEWSDVIAEPV